MWTPVRRIRGTGAGRLVNESLDFSAISVAFRPVIRHSAGAQRVSHMFEMLIAGSDRFFFSRSMCTSCLELGDHRALLPCDYEIRRSGRGVASRQNEPSYTKPLASRPAFPIRESYHFSHFDDFFSRSKFFLPLFMHSIWRFLSISRPVSLCSMIFDLFSSIFTSITLAFGFS